MAIDLHYYYGDCSTPEAQAQIKQNFVKILIESGVTDECDDKCKAENVVVTCSLVDSVNDRRRREAGMVKSRWKERGWGWREGGIELLSEDLDALASWISYPTSGQNV